MSFFSDIFGSKKASRESLKDIGDAEDRTAASRARLLATEGGASGEELEEGSTKKRQTLLGN